VSKNVYTTFCLKGLRQGDDYRAYGHIGLYGTVYFAFSVTFVCSSAAERSSTWRFSRVPNPHSFCAEIRPETGSRKVDFSTAEDGRIWYRQRWVLFSSLQFGHAGQLSLPSKTSVTTHFKKLTTGNSVFIVSLIVQSNCHRLRFLHQMFSALLPDDTLLKCVVTEVVLYSVVAFKTLTFHAVV